MGQMVAKKEVHAILRTKWLTYRLLFFSFLFIINNKIK